MNYDDISTYKNAVKCSQEFIEAVQLTAKKYPELADQAGELIEIEHRILNESRKELIHALRNKKV